MKIPYLLIFIIICSCKPKDGNFDNCVPIINYNDLNQILIKWQTSNFESLKEYKKNYKDAKGTMYIYQKMKEQINYISDTCKECKRSRKMFTGFWLYNIIKDTKNNMYILERDCERSGINRSFFYIEIEYQEYSSYYLFDENRISWDSSKCIMAPKGYLDSIYKISYEILNKAPYTFQDFVNSNNLLIITLFNNKCISSNVICENSYTREQEDRIMFFYGKIDSLLE